MGCADNNNMSCRKQSVCLPLAAVNTSARACQYGCPAGGAGAAYCISLTTIYPESTMTEPRGILRNKQERSGRRELADELDRQEVIRNTMLNANLASESSKGDEIRAKIAEAKKQDGSNGGSEDDASAGSHEHLKWDEINLYNAEQEKSATMKIDEPKTPYTGGFNPNGEYYQDDKEEIPDFNLGASEADRDAAPSDSLNGGLIYVDPNQNYDDNDDDDEQDEPKEELTAEERHRRFEEKRKEHYHMKALPLKHSVQVDED